MNIQLPVHMVKTGFLAWVEGREERYELVEGRAIMMVGASRGHGRIVRKYKAWVWIRGDNGFPTAPTTVSGGDNAIHVEALRITIPLKDAYEGVRLR